MRVLVAGAGVAGLAAARGLVRAGHEVEVHERAPALRTVGGSVTLWSGSTGILRDLGVDLTGVGRRIDTMESWSSGGRPLVTVDIAAVARRYGTPNVHLPRQRLVERLADGLPEGTLRFGSACTRVDPERGGLVLADGGTARGDVVVGADGRSSAVRDHLWGADPARLTEWVTWQGFIRRPLDLVSSHRAIMIVGREGLCGLIPAGEGLLLWWFDHRVDHREPPPASPAEALAERFGSWAAPVPEVLSAIDGIDRFTHHRHRVPKVWGRGRATLAGDAAHSMPPTMAQGANQALEDGWTLARELDGAGPVTERLRRYERIRSRHAARAADLAATEQTDRYRPPALMRLLPDRLVTAGYTAWLRRVSTYLTTTA
ncbi:FAD-dependent monooxygenase [Planomonospora sp. ID91781]|uniref:FAD-dependent oxidoreductase n=1 Tax=Planomonospora sp. ID91781 TaxID=2738135 RepID=UPI0018C3C650|nr:FAD-dependent monooxygenase [Planomonospora sp. ID91781]MBG0819400.1 FAD-dependent monooxygenase [Planomonospora sp. ID91781]